MEDNAVAMEAHPGAVEDHHRAGMLSAMKAHPEAVKTYPGAMEAHPGEVEGHTRALEALIRAVEAHSGVVRLPLESH
jgi:hypothetical protein